MTDEAGRLMRFEAAKKSVLVAYLLWFFLGFFGLHRFYLGHVVSGVILVLLWLIGSGLVFIPVVGWIAFAVPVLWWAIDALLIPGMARKANERIIAEIERGQR